MNSDESTTVEDDGGDVDHGDDNALLCSANCVNLISPLENLCKSICLSRSVDKTRVHQ